MSDLNIIRFAFAVLLGFITFYLSPFGLRGWAAAALGVLVAAIAILVEYRIRRIPLQRLLGAATGSLIGLVAAMLISIAVGADNPSFSFVRIALAMIAVYVGAAVGASKGELLNLSALGGVLGGEKPAGKESIAILDTSVIIDGRIADVAETGFLGGPLAIPQFVLRELQLVADSSDSIKRNRGRRGLDVLQRIQKMPQLRTRIVEDDFPAVREVDLKLIELAKLYQGRIVTNDFNLNKVAQLHRVPVLNINELANALKPVVLPGEIMRVFVLKEGKEYNQGVAYLDDGTMVVVDNARKMISKTIDIAVTSVLQTTAGKMIFGKFDERTHAIYDPPQRGERHNPREQTNAASAG